MLQEFLAKGIPHRSHLLVHLLSFGVTQARGGVPEALGHDRGRGKVENTRACAEQRAFAGRPFASRSRGRLHDCFARFANCVEVATFKAEVGQADIDLGEQFLDRQFVIAPVADSFQHQDLPVSEIFQVAIGWQA